MQSMTQEAYEKHQMSIYRDNRSTYRKTALLVSLFFGVTLFYFYSRRTPPEVVPSNKLSEKIAPHDVELPAEPKLEIDIAPPESSEKMDWKTVDLKASTISSNIQTAAGKVQIETGTKDIQNTQVFYREAKIPEAEEVKPSGQCLLLLHGMAFKSETWMKDINTLQMLAAMGHRAVAIDLPGYGESPKASVEDKAKFLEEVIEKFGLDHPVVISPSMSGGWSIPLLKSRPELLGGYVPVAPVETGSVSQETYESLNVPTLIVYGELDKGLGVVSYKDLKHIPTSRAYELPNARHPAYLDQTEEWHQLLYNFMLKLKRPS